MSRDPSLVEVVAQVIRHNTEPDSLYDHEYVELANAILAAIDASGIAWVAPWEIDRREFSIRMTPWPEDSDSLFARIRDACLAERRGEGR